jgi:hypothetical protein
VVNRLLTTDLSSSVGTVDPVSLKSHNLAYSAVKVNVEDFHCGNLYKEEIV